MMKASCLNSSNFLIRYLASSSFSSPVCGGETKGE